ncbi:hypothetical protein V6Z12_D03G204800 [Gossypium hirsutum]
MGEWEWRWWQTTWENGSGAGGRQHGRMGRGGSIPIDKQNNIF